MRKNSLSRKPEWKCYSERTERRWENDVKVGCSRKRMDSPGPLVCMPQYTVKSYNGLEL